MIKFDIQIIPNSVTGRVDFYFVCERNGERNIALPVNFIYVPIQENRQCSGPTFSFDNFTAKKFMEDLANKLEKVGVLQEGVEGMRGKLEATERHLEDMRKLVFKEVKKCGK